MSVGADRNLLFGVLALQMDFIKRDDLIAAMHDWALAKSKPLGEILVERGALQPQARDALDQIVRIHILSHGSSVEKSLASLTADVPLTEDLRKTIDDPDVERSIGLLSGPATEVDDTHSFLPSQSSDSIRYQKLRNHVQGGLGVIFIARDLELNREVALKEIKPAYAKDGTSRNRFVVEAEVTGGLEHPGVVPVYGLGRYEDGRPYYAMRFIKGESLKEAIDRVHKSDEGIDLDPGQRLLALQKLLRRFLDVCNAIEYAHSRGVLHRDLKPKNIMVGQYGETLVVDWGLAKAVGKFEEEEDSPEATLRPTYSSGSTDTIPGSVLGTPQYMSPEQASGRLDQLRPASDVYSLGATLYAILTGKSPFASEKAEEVLPKVQKGEFPKPRQIVKWIDPRSKRYVSRRWLSNRLIATRLPGLWEKTSSAGLPTNP